MPEVVPLVMFVAWLSSGCGDNRRPDALPDAETMECSWEPPRDDQRYTTSSDFDSADCSGDILEIDLVGIWRLDVDTRVVYPGLIYVRLEMVGGEWKARLDGYTTSDVAIDAKAIIRAKTPIGLMAVDICGATVDGGINGALALCTDAGCLEGGFVGEKLEPLVEQPSANMQLISEFGPWNVDSCSPSKTLNVRISGDVAYLVRSDSLHILDVRDEAAITELGVVHANESEIFNDVKVIEANGADKYVVVASSTRGGVIVDVTNAASPSIVSVMSPPVVSGVHTLFIEGSRAYLSNGDFGLDIWDVSNPRAPQRLSEGPNLFEKAYLHDLYVADSRAYLAHYNNDLEVVDITNPNSPNSLGLFRTAQSHSAWTTNAAGRKIAALGGEGLGHRLALVDVTEGSDMYLSEISSWGTREDVSIHNVEAHGDLVFIAYYQDGIRVLDIATPEEPVEVAHFQTWNGIAGPYGSDLYEGAIGLDVHPGIGRIYVADTHRGLLVLEYSGQ